MDKSMCDRIVLDILHQAETAADGDPFAFIRIIRRVSNHLRRAAREARREIYIEMVADAIRKERMEKNLAH